MCVPNALPSDPSTAPRGPWQADAVAKPDSVKGVQKVEDYHKAQAMMRERLGILGNAAQGFRAGQGPLTTFGGDSGGGGTDAASGKGG